MEKKKHYLVYQITNTVNGKIYIGKHETYDVDDGYMGSGKILKRALLKYGLENFVKTILFDFETEEEMNLKERELVDETFIERNDTYNLMLGGNGGFSFAHKRWLELQSDESFQQRMIEARRRLWSNPVFRAGFIARTRALNVTEEHRRKMSEALKRYYSTHPGTWTGRHHTDEERQKISLAKTGKHMACENHRYGAHWWKDPNDRTKSMSIKDGEPVPEGWVRGRWCFGGSQLKHACKFCGSVGLVGEVHCKHPEICKNHKIFTTMIQYFGMEKDCLGTERLYDEFLRVKRLIHVWCFDEHLSLLDIIHRTKYPYGRGKLRRFLHALFAD